MAKFDNKFESAKQDWATPQNLFDELNKEFNFTFDLAASKENTKCNKYFTKEDNGLLQKWNGICWLNPPYGSKNDKISDWVKKAYQETLNSDTVVVMLIPARTNTKWFHEYCMKAAEVRFILGRPKFGNATHGLPQPLCLVVFKKANKTIFSSYKIPA